MEYHDPSGVFPLISNDITSRLPLSNLNWHSPPRPLRQIKSLHVDFVPDKDTQELLNTTATGTKRGQDGNSTSLDIVRGGPDAHKVGKQRRHQIPGLKTSPYLKIYVLRCDDKAGYKESEKKSIREWIKENVPPEGKRENHDACEWLILHVVIPDTVAASEPRWREVSSKDADELKERPKSKAKWPGKGDRTVFDRLRADFNESGKSGQDRVAQIRIPKAQVPADLLPTPAVASTHVESGQERENAWNDLMAKFKTLILGPFDRRVRQYEADIAEQEARRSLPGWNFCTFFIHKEGLAKALESVGLVEDALAIYDELSLDLETVLRDLATGSAEGTATSFAPTTDDIRDRVMGSRGNNANGTTNDTQDERNDASSLFSKDYREKIVRSDISVFDFLCYIFIRQKTLILRLANARSARKELGTDSRDGGEDLVLTSEVCWRASNFIHNTSRVLRQDLASARTSGKSTYNQDEIDGLVSSWIYAVSGMVLEETAVAALLEVTKLDSSSQGQPVNGKSKRSTISLALGANPYPQRSSSLHSGRDSLTPEQARTLAQLTGRDTTALPTPPQSSSGEGTVQSVPGLPGQAELATYRAELMAMRRNMLEQAARQRGFFAGWASLRREQFMPTKIAAPEKDADQDTERTKLLVGPSLLAALESEVTFCAKFEALTDVAIRHFLAATQNKSAERLMGDIALLKYQQKDFFLAAAYFERIVPLYSADRWDLMEARATMIYAQCLERLGKTKQYVTVLLTLATRLCGSKKQQTLSRHEQANAQKTEEDQTLDACAILKDIFSASENLEDEVTQPFEVFFGGLTLDRAIIHDDMSDTIGLSLQIRHVLDTALTVNEVALRLVNADDDSQNLWLRNTGAVQLNGGLNDLHLVTRTIAVGPFLADRVIVRAKNIIFVEELRQKPAPNPLGIVGTDVLAVPSTSKPPQCVYIYPRKEAFHAEISSTAHLFVDKSRQLDVILEAGTNDISSISVRVKPASAGLRVHSADAIATGIQAAKEALTPGHISLAALEPKGKAIVTIPYSLEQAAREIYVRFEVDYSTASGVHTFIGSARLSNDLPLDVEVNDVFHLDTLFSNFTARTTGSLPYSIVGASLDESPAYQVEQPSNVPFPLTVFSSQPLSLVYKISRKKDLDPKLRKKEAALALHLEYSAIEEFVTWYIRRQFSADLQQSEFDHLARLLLVVLAERCKELFTVPVLELAALMRTIEMIDYNSIGWGEILPMVPPPSRGPLETWLKQWHLNNTTIDLGAESSDGPTPRKLTISVDVPNIDSVFHVALNLTDTSADLRGSTLPALALGQPVKAQLRIGHTDAWSSKSMFPNTPRVKIQGDEEKEASFTCEVGVDSDTWLIGGRRRFRFRPDDGGARVHDILLVPVKLGIHPLPVVEMRVETPLGDDEQAAHQELEVTCETHYKSAAQLVQVVRDLRTSKVLIEESPAHHALELPLSRPGSSSTSALAGA